jgi:hypothetical protein
VWISCDATSPKPAAQLRLIVRLEDRAGFAHEFGRSRPYARRAAEQADGELAPSGTRCDPADARSDTGLNLVSTHRLPEITGADEGADAFRDIDAGLNLPASADPPTFRSRTCTSASHFFMKFVRASRTRFFLNGLQNARRSLGLRGGWNKWR